MSEPFEELPCHASARRGFVEEAVSLLKVLNFCQSHGGGHHLCDPIEFKVDFPVGVIESNSAGPHSDQKMRCLVEPTACIEQLGTLLEIKVRKPVHPRRVFFLRGSGSEDIAVHVTGANPTSSIALHTRISNALPALACR